MMLLGPVKKLLMFCDSFHEEFIFENLNFNHFNCIPGNSLKVYIFDNVILWKMIVVCQCVKQNM